MTATRSVSRKLSVSSNNTATTTATIINTESTSSNGSNNHPAPVHKSHHTKSTESSRSILHDILLLSGCTFGIYFCFIVFGLIHERLYSRPGFNHSLFLVCCQCIGNCAFALLTALITGNSLSTGGIPIFDYIGISVSYIGSMFVSNTALSYISYPAQVLAKSCKLIPVMLMRIIVNKQRYTIREYLQVLSITAGICVFMLGDGRGSNVSNKPQQVTTYTGLILCFVSLILDGWTSPKQEQLNSKYKPSMSAMQFYMNFYSIILCLIGLLLTQQIMPAIHYIQSNPDIIIELILFGLLSALGQSIILYTLLTFNSLILVTITTTRKLFTILASVIYYGHNLTIIQWTGVSLVFIGLGIESIEKYQSKKKSKLNKQIAPEKQHLI